jgi:hypothetical protein
MHNDVGSCNAMAFEDIPDSSCGDWIGWPYQWIGLRCQQARIAGVSQYCQQCSHQFEISRRDMLALERDWVSQKRADSRMIRSDPYRNTGQCAEPGSPPVIIAQDDQGHGTASSETAGESKEQSIGLERISSGLSAKAWKRRNEYLVDQPAKHEDLSGPWPDEERQVQPVLGGPKSTQGGNRQECIGQVGQGESR